ncbi:GGDEF domain-containing protein, partial [Mesorhizobium sp. M2D.F.Ca.ET.160.01.1.1]
ALGEAKTKPLAILSLDLDRFKAVNETFGHPAGDWLLKCVAERLQRCLRGEKDVVARFGGDEFAIIQSNVKGAADAERLAKRITEVIGRPYPDKSREMHLGVSLGIALYPDYGQDAD